MKPVFFLKNNIYYNVNQIVKFETKGVTHILTMSNGEIVEMNTGILKLEELIYVNQHDFDKKYTVVKYHDND